MRAFPKRKFTKEDFVKKWQGCFREGTATPGILNTVTEYEQKLSSKQR